VVPKARIKKETIVTLKEKESKGKGKRNNLLYTSVMIETEKDFVPSQP
jgi:hypothetical protein